MSHIEDKAKQIISEQLGIKIETIHTDSLFVDDLGADSLDTVELIMALEDEFDCEIPDEDAEKIIRVSDAIAYIESKKEAE